MTLENVKSLRENFKMNGLGIILINDNMQIFNSLNNFFIWDDQKQTVAAIRVNNTRYRTQAPMEIIVTEYDHIQYMNSYIPRDKVTELLKGLNMPECNDELIKKIIDYIDNELAPIGTEINKEYTNTNPMNRDNTLPGSSFDDKTWVNVSYYGVGGDIDLVLFRSNVMKITEEFKYAPAALMAAETYGLSIGRRFDEWDKSEEEILTEIRGSLNVGNGMPMVKVTAKYKLI